MINISKNLYRLNILEEISMLFLTVVLPHLPSGSSNSLDSSSPASSSLYFCHSAFVSVAPSLTHIFSRSASCPPPLSQTNCPLCLSPSVSFISVVLCAPLHLSPSTPLFSAFICFWPQVGRPHIQRPVALLILLKAPAPCASSLSVCFL